MQPKVYSVSDHDIDPHLVDHDALYVLHTLREAGFVAYLVGGSVRDLLIKKSPKDFDISTSALPEQIKHLFQRRCLLIGRRFRLAHIRFGHKIFEVSTFRSGDDAGDLILQDNQWGSPEQDALRRDFTINGLFYDPEDHSVIDYVGGWEDIHKNVLRTIGNPEIRFRQDPVRMIRLLKFRARFGFNIAPDVRAALIKCREDILKSSPARILEEVLRMLESGASAPFFNLLAQSGLLELLYPSLSNFLNTSTGKDILLYLASADQINLGLNKAPLDRATLAACLVFPMLQQELKTEFLDKKQIPHMGDIIILAGAAIKKFEFNAFPRFPRRITAIMGSLLANQYRLTPLIEKKNPHPRIFRQKDMNEALTFLKIRAQIDKNLIDIYSNWKSMYKQHSKNVPRKAHPNPPPHAPHHTEHIHHPRNGSSR